MKQRKIWGILLGLVAAVTLGLGVFSACTPEETPPDAGGYLISVKSEGGAPIPDATVTLRADGGSEVAHGTTDASGLATFADAPAGEYTVEVADYPIGYFMPDNVTYKTNARFDPVTVILHSQIITDREPPENFQYTLGDVAYDFSITGVDGTEYRLSEMLEGKLMVLLNFWDLQCGPCMSEMPGLQRSWLKYQDKAALLAVDANNIGDTDTESGIKDHFEDNGYTMPAALDVDKELVYLFNTTSVPVSAVVDRYGVVVEIHVGGMTEAQFDDLFQKYTADDYSQGVGPGGVVTPGSDDEPQRVKPNVSMPDPSVLAEAANGSGYAFTYRPDTESSQQEYSWPWFAGEEDGRTFIYPSNYGVGYSFAIVRVDFTITEEDIEAGKTVVAFDIKFSTENDADYLYLSDGTRVVYEYTGDETGTEWKTYYAVVAIEAGDYTLTFMYDKDQYDPDDFVEYVCIGNISLINKDQIEGGLDMPRNAATGYDEGTGSFTEFISTAKDSEGFYRKDNGNGPYVFADLMELTNFNLSIGNQWSISNYAVNGDFDYNEVGIDDPGYDPDKDKTEAITRYLRAANNSRMYGLVVVDETLKGLLNEFVDSKKPAQKGNENNWLEFCTWFEHYGSDPSDTGINTPEKNPVRGLMFETAIATKPVIEKGGAATDANKNEVVYDRMLIPRGILYKFTPQTSGVYRIETQSKQDADTMAWIYENDGTINGKMLLSVDEQLEDAELEYNLRLTYYFEEGKDYYISVAFADIGVTNKFTFTIEDMGASYFAWQYTAREYFTLDDNANLPFDRRYRVYKSVEPVLYEGQYYDALRNSDGSVFYDGNGFTYANLNDPIYLDVSNGTHFDVDLSVAQRFYMSEVGGEKQTDPSQKALQDMGVLRRVQIHFDRTFHLKDLEMRNEDGSRYTDPTLAKYYLLADSLEEKAAGGDVAWSQESREAFITSIIESYGFERMPEEVDESTLGPQDLADLMGAYVTKAHFAAMVNATTFGEIVEVLRTNYIHAFDAADLETMRTCIQQAAAGEGVGPKNNSADYGYDKYPELAGTSYAGKPFDKGCVLLTEELCEIMEKYCSRFGLSYVIGNQAYPVHDQYLQLCRHYKFIGSWDAYKAWCSPQDGAVAQGWGVE